MKKEKKPKKKLTLKEREEKKQYIKKLILGFVHVISYILSFLFLVVCVIAACTGGCSPKKARNNVTTPINNNVPFVNRAFTPTPKEESDNIIFYKSDIKTDVTYYLHLNFSNYNFLEYFVPNPTKLLSFDEILHDHIVSNNGSQKELYLPLCSYENNQVVGGVKWYGNYLSYLSIICNYASNSYTWSIIDDNDNYYDLFKWDNDIYTSYLNNTVNDYNGEFDSEFYLYDLFDYLFTSNEVFFEFNSYSSPTSIEYITIQFFAYYLSNYSFDFNSYKFGGMDKYTSFTYLFRRLYNGFFIYCPNQTNVYLEQKLFSGVWEFQNTIYTSINIRLMRAFNGSISNDDPYNNPVRANRISVLYFNSSSNSSIWFDSIFSGSNTGLVNYYFIDEIYMTGVNGQSFTLAYNKISKSIADSVLSVNVYPSINLRVFQDDSFLYNNQTEFTLYSIDYDYNFTPNQTIFLTYNYYSDFFFTAFYYTGLYHTIKPGSDNQSTTIIITPVFDLLTGALLGLLPLFNTQLLPNITFGVLLLLPFVVSIILFVVKLFKR